MKSALFENLFAQERSGISGRNYLTGTLWALESIAWEEKHLVRATLALGALDSIDPGGNWGNRPGNSLTTIFLPWLPQTMASVEKRRVAIETLAREYPKTAWKVLLTLLPGRVTSSSYTHKPTWRKVVPQDWKSDVSNEDYGKQISAYSEMAVELAKGDPSRLLQLIGNLDHLPRPSFEKALQLIESKEITERTQVEKNGLWTALLELATKHRRFAGADWALPQEAISKIEATATKMAPVDIRDVNKRLFAGRDWDLYEEKGHWQEQERKLEERRKDVLSKIIEDYGLEAAIAFVDLVESPQQVGSALALAAGENVDASILPTMLNSGNEKQTLLAVGYVWTRHRKSGWDWVDRTFNRSWPKADLARFFTLLPFAEETWSRVTAYLGDDPSAYWKKVNVNPYQSSGDLGVAVDNLLHFGRPWAAIDCLAKSLQDKHPLDQKRVVRALLDAVSSKEGYDVHDAVELIKALQESPDTREEDLAKIEWLYLSILEGNHGARPKCLESHLSLDPAFFCEVIAIVYRSSKEPAEGKKEPTPQDKAIAEQAWRLLHEWETPPGMDAEGNFSADKFKEWIEAVKKSSTESGRFAVALHHAGAALLKAPPDPSGLWMHRAIADVMNDQANEELRVGYRMAAHNSRGAHWVDPTGKPEKELAAKYRKQADDIENAGYQRIAASLRDLAESFEQEAARIIQEHKDEVIDESQ